MRFDLRTPCKNCPFRTDATAIRFSCRERAEEIEESAYRHGFPCHLSADLIEEDDGDSDGYVFGENTQHCAGALIMYTRDGDGPVPFTWLPERRQDAIRERLDWSAPVFDDEQAFLEFYGSTEDDSHPSQPSDGEVARAKPEDTTEPPPPSSVQGERDAIAAEARRYASHYPLGSDGSNTFIMFAEWAEARGEGPSRRKNQDNQQ